jgi:hypothetical protein
MARTKRVASKAQRSPSRAFASGIRERQAQSSLPLRESSKRQAHPRYGEGDPICWLRGKAQAKETGVLCVPTSSGPSNIRAPDNVNSL